MPVPDAPFPRVNSRDEMVADVAKHGGLPSDPAIAEKLARAHIEALKAKAFRAAT